jgi:hypothetical protein
VPALRRRARAAARLLEARGRRFPVGLARRRLSGSAVPGTELAETVSVRPGARAYRVTPSGEEAIEPRLLLSGP